MKQFDRIYRLHTLFANRRTPMPLAEIMERMGCAKATAERDLKELRDYLGAPLAYDREAKGYFYDLKNGAVYELPGLWFSAEELNGLLICQQILQNISPGILSQQINRLQQRIDKLFALEQQATPQIARKIKFLGIGRRLKNDEQFQKMATALFQSQQIHIEYRKRAENGKLSQRTISPQQLVYHRDNWYIVAYCHCRNELRPFAIDCIQSSKLLQGSALAVDTAQVEAFISAAYGIFCGKAEHQAVLEFSPARAQWVADETWHEEQQARWLENGNYQLSIPFSDSRELLMDILKYGADVEVKAPEFLRGQVIEQIAALQKKYNTLIE